MLARTLLNLQAISMDVSSERSAPAAECKILNLKKKKKIGACLAVSIVLQRIRVEFILFRLHSRESSPLDTFAE